MYDLFLFLLVDIGVYCCWCQSPDTCFVKLLGHVTVENIGTSVYHIIYCQAIGAGSFCSGS